MQKFVRPIAAVLAVALAAMPQVVQADNGPKIIQPRFGGEVQVIGVPTSGQVIVWDSTKNLWTNGTSSGPTTSTWATVLGNGASSGGHNPTITNGDSFLFGSDVSQARSGTRQLTIGTGAAGGDIAVVVSGSLEIQDNSAGAIAYGLTNGYVLNKSADPYGAGSALAVTDGSGAFWMFDCGELAVFGYGAAGSKPVFDLASFNSDALCSMSSGGQIVWSTTADASTGVTDARCYKSAAKTIQWDDSAGGALTDFKIIGKLTVTGAIDPTSVSLSTGTALFFDSADGSTAPVSGANHGRIRYLDGTGWQVSSNTGAYATLATSGSVTLQGAYNGGPGITLGAGGAVALTKGVNDSTNAFTVTVSAGTGLAGLFTGATISCPGGGASSERFGSGATAGGLTANAFGNGATASSASSLAFGTNATSAAPNSIAIGTGATVGAAISDAIVIGTGGTAGAIQAIAIGTNSNAASAASIALGYGSTTTTANQFVVGSTANSITDTWIGNGVTNASPATTTLHSTGASGANTAGAGFTIAVGQGTGSAAGGSFSVNVANAAGAGSSQNALFNAFIVTSTGSSGFTGTADNALDVTTPVGRSCVFQSPGLVPGGGSSGWRDYVSIDDLTTAGTGVGGGVTFRGYVSGTSAFGRLAGLQARKINATVNDRTGYLVTTMNTGLAGNDVGLDVHSLSSTAQSDLISTGVWGWTSSATVPTGSPDTGLSRDSAGNVAVGTGAAGSKAGSLKFTSGTLSGGLVFGTPTIVAGQIAWGTGLGAITHMQGPTDQVWTWVAGAGADWLMQDSTGNSNIRIRNSGAGVNISGSLAFSSTVATYDNSATAGKGLSSIRAAANATAQSAANSSIATYTPGQDCDLDVSAQLSVTAATALTTSLNVTYTDVAGVSRTLILPVTTTDGNWTTNGTITASGAAIFHTAVVQIRAKASTAVTILTATGTFTGVTYSASGVIKRSS